MAAVGTVTIRRPAWGSLWLGPAGVLCSHGDRGLDLLARQKVGEWRSLLERHVPQARQVLSKLRRKKLVFQPEERLGKRGDTLTRVGTIVTLLTGSVPEFSQAVTSPSGVALQFHHDESAMSLRVASPNIQDSNSDAPRWAELSGLLSGARSLRKALGSVA